MDEVGELERRLREQQERVEKLLEAARFNSEGLSGAEFTAARKSQADAERKFYLAKGEEAGVPLDWPVPWDAGAPIPHVLAANGLVYLAYLTEIADPDWDGKNVKIVSPSNPSEERIALVKFESCRSHRLGDPNDEAMNGHPLWGRGLEPYRAHIVENSTWVRQLMQCNSKHPYFSENHWRNCKHYLLMFHDETFECVADGFKIELHYEPFSKVLQTAVDRLVQRG